MTSANNNNESNERSVLAERQHTINVIQSLQRLIIRAINLCPEFCIGLLQDALDAAFGLGLIKKRRPLLIYVHHNARMSDLFSSKILIEYLTANYVVWPWDISLERNRQILIRMWKENVSEDSLIEFTMDQCPMLIGIQRQFSMENRLFFKYQPEVLLMDDVLMRTNEEFDSEILFYQLIIFRQEFLKNEQYLSSDFVQKIIACPELVIEIAEYLPLNDAVATFSIGVLPVLWRYNRKLPVIKPSEEFIKTMIESNNQDKILSLRLEGNQFAPAVSDTFANVTSLTIINLQEMRQICEIRTYFFNVTSFRLHYDEKIDFHNTWKILELLPESIKRLDIDCDSIKCSHYRLDYVFTQIEKFNQTVEAFTLHLGYISRSLVNNCWQSFSKCTLRTITDFMRIMPNIRDVRLILDQGSIEPLLDVVEWLTLLDICQQLERINLKAMKKTSGDNKLDERIKEIEDNLLCKQKLMKFEVQMK